MKHPLKAGQPLPDLSVALAAGSERSLLAFLAQEARPTLFVFLPNFGSPISRFFLPRYFEGAAQLQAARLAVVVKSERAVVQQALAGTEWPFAVLCDAAGELYRAVGVGSRAPFWAATAASNRIVRAAKKEGYRRPKGEKQLLPVTLIASPQGEVLYIHYGQSATDLPEDCAAMQRVMEQLLQRLPGAESWQTDLLEV